MQTTEPALCQEMQRIAKMIGLCDDLDFAEEGAPDVLAGFVAELNAIFARYTRLRIAKGFPAPTWYFGR